jgi:hypothetical protein
MRQILFYLVAAMAAMFTLPATAAEGWEGLAPVYSEATPALAVADDSPMLAERSAMRQLEAAVNVTNSNDGHPGDDAEGLFHVADISGKNLPYEVAWRS